MFDELKAHLREDPVDSLTRAQLNDRFAEVRRIRGSVAAYQARLVRAVDGLGDQGLDGKGVLRAQGKTSSKAATRAAETARMMSEMPKVEEALEEGRITAEHADVVAEAAKKVSPSQAESALLGDGEIPPADVFAKRGREWAGKNTKDDGTADHEAQRRNRTGKHWVDDDSGMFMFLFGLDRESAETVSKALGKREKQMWRDDGGRNGPPADMRTSDQRMADAFVELITDTAAGSPSHPMHQVNAVFDVNGMTDDHGRPLASLVSDGQPLPAAVLDRIACTAGITPMIFDGPGRPIWVGRDHRSATISQWRALIARDRGCVGCGADAARCEAHHIIAWEAWGYTDIDNLVLVCSRCHHDLHDRGMVLRRSEGRWHIVSREGPAPLPDREDDLRLIA